MSRRVEQVVAGLALLVLAPLLALLAALIVLLDGRPVLFRQERMGQYGRRFRMLKFRSMRQHRPGRLITASTDTRVTGVGRWLRRTKFDELPQLVNVLRGEMSFIGPRPEVPELVDLQDAKWAAVLRVRPGITDLATLVFRDEEEVLGRAHDPETLYRTSVQPRKLRLNLEHIGTRTLRSDVLLVMLTAWWSLFPRGFDAARAYRMVTKRQYEQ